MEITCSQVSFFLLKKYYRPSGYSAKKLTKIQRVRDIIMKHIGKELMRAFWKVDRCDDDELRSKNTSVIPSLTNFPYLKDDTRTNWTVVSPYRSSLKMDGLKYGNQDDGFKKQSKTAKHSRNPSMDKDD